MNSYRSFIPKYAKVTLPLTELQKKTDNAGELLKGQPLYQMSENSGRLKWEWMRQDELAFRKLKSSFTDTPILQHFDAAKPIILQTVASGFAIAGILNQYDVSRFSGQSISTPGSALQPNRITTLMVGSYGLLWKH